MGETLNDYIWTFTTTRDQSICTNSISDDIDDCRSIMPAAASTITIKSDDFATCFGTSYADVDSIIFRPDGMNSDEDIKEEKAMDLHPVKIIFNDPVSVVFWEDGEKTVVRRHEGEPYDKYTAFCAALAIKIFGSNTEVNRIVRNGIDQQEKDLRKAEKIAMKQKAERMAKKAKKNG